MEKLKIQKREVRKNRGTTVGMRVDIATYQQIESVANKANYSMIEMLELLVSFAVDNLEIVEAEKGGDKR